MRLRGWLIVIYEPKNELSNQHFLYEHIKHASVHVLIIFMILYTEIYYYFVLNAPMRPRGWIFFIFELRNEFPVQNYP